MALILCVFFTLLANEVGCQPATNSTVLKDDGLSLGEKLKIARYASALIAPIVVAIGGTIAAYCLYKNTTKVAKNLMDASKEAYNVTVGCLKNAYCWSSNVFCSSLTCCSQRGYFWCCRDQLYGSCCRKEEARPLISSSIQPMVRTDNCEPINNYNHHYNKMLEKSTEVDIYRFLKLHQFYSGTPSYLSHATYCMNQTCIDNKHKHFEKYGGIALEPFIYYLVLDWSYLRFQNINSDATTKDLFKLIFRRNQPYLEEFNDEWEDMKRKLKRNIFLTLVNFPEASFVNISRETNEGRLLVLVVDLYNELQICVGNRVKSSFQVDEESNKVLEDGSKECRLSLTPPLKTFPSGRDLASDNLLQRLKILDLDKPEHNKIINRNQTSEFFDLEPTENRISKIVLKNIPSQTKNLVCRIYLGDEIETKDNGTWNKVPYIESPKIIFGRLPVSTSVASTTVASTSAASTSAASTSPANVSTADEFTFADEDGGNLKLFSTTEHLLKEKEKQELGGLLDSGLHWRKVGQKIFKDIKGGKQNELDDIKINGGSTGCGLKFLEILKANETGHNMSWGTFIEKCENHKVYGIKDALTLDENEQFKDSVVVKLGLICKENIGRKLDVLSRWKILADHEFGMEQSDITKIERARKNPESFSPTEYLLLLIWQIYPDTVLKTLARACWDVDLKNVVKVLKRIGREKMLALKS